MEIATATVVPGSESQVGSGTTGALRCVLVLGDGTRRSAILKRGPMGQIAAEAFCALLLRGWGLPVPDPFLIDEPGGLAFASADVGYPNLKQRIGLAALPDGPAKQAAYRRAMTLASSFKTAALATAADEAIDNRDRNLENILWDGTAEAWIDHAYALGQGMHLPDLNKMCFMACELGQADKACAASVAQALAIDRSAPAAAGTAMPSPIDGPGLAQAVSARVAGLAVRLLARFPQPPDLLSNA